jgi:hypothetical protein
MTSQLLREKIGQHYLRFYAQTCAICEVISYRNDFYLASWLDYESPALTAELQAHHALMREHPTFNVQPLTGDEFSAKISDCPPRRVNLLPNECGFGIGA